MEYITRVKCPECGHTNHLGRFDEEECYKCGKDLHAVIQGNKKR